jgi:two-component system OmpR family sensor kinase
MKWRWLIGVIPAGAGLVASALLAGDQRADPVFYVRADLPALVALAGLLLSALIVVALGLQTAIRRAGERHVAEVRGQTTEERRCLLQRLDHEFKNPLTAIRAGLVNLAAAPLGAAQQDALSSVENQVLRLSRLTADMRKLAELEVRPLERGQVDLDQVLRDVVAAVQERQETGERRLTLTLPQAPWPLPTVSGDQDLISLAVHNLVDNALKFSRPGDTIEVRAFEDGATVAVEVADTGPGIPEEEVPLVWEELYRGRQARAVPGSGLGLALVRAIAERHDGHVTLQSRAGQGTVVGLRIPVK